MSNRWTAFYSPWIWPNIKFQSNNEDTPLIFPMNTSFVIQTMQEMQVVDMTQSFYIFQI